jgi:hypothetical protein
MAFYVTIIILLILFSFGRLGNVKQVNILRVAMLALYFFATFRALEIGNDTKAYYDLFMRIGRYHNLEMFTYRFEIGYLLLNDIISRLTENFWVFLGIVNAVIYYAYYRLIKEYSENLIMSVFMFFVLGTWGQTMNIIRLQLAIAMYIYAFLAKERGNYIVSIVAAILAVFFQRISIVYSIVFLVPKKIKKNTYIITVAGTAATVAFLPTILKWAVKLVPYFKTYLTSSTYVVDEIKWATVIGFLMELTIFVFSMYVYVNQLDELEQEESELFAQQLNMVFIAMMITIISFRFNILSRCQYFFSVFEILLLPNAIRNMRLKTNRFLLLFAVLGVCIAYFVIVNVYRPNWNYIYPYETVFSTGEFNKIGF